MTWMTTISGVMFDVVNPNHELVTALDIAHHLSLINRFNGATWRPYSVAEHSLLVLEIAERELRVTDPSALLACFMHDGHEAYFGDVISPVKHELGAPASIMELRLARTVQRRFGLITASTAYEDVIRRADLMALATERRDLVSPHRGMWSVLTGIEPVTWVDLRDRADMDWQDWRKAFIDRFGELNFARVQASERICAIPSDTEVEHADKPQAA